jgi:hypothetical protein
MSYSRAEIAELSKRIGRSPSCLWQWAAEGCDLRSYASVQSWITKKKLHERNAGKARAGRARRRRRDNNQDTQRASDVPAPERVSSVGNGEILPPAGKRGAAAALERLEASEERAHARLEAALLRGDAVQIAACQDFWLKCSETLRRLDLAVETARREAETQVPLRTACDAQTAAAEWMRISVMQFLSSETLALMAFKDGGEFRHYFVTRFKGILELTIKNADQTNSPVPLWALERIKIAWNVTNV